MMPSPTARAIKIVALRGAEGLSSRATTNCQRAAYRNNFAAAAIICRVFSNTVATSYVRTKNAQ